MKSVRTVSGAVRQLCTMAGEITEFALTEGSQCPPTKPGVLRLYSMRFCPYAQKTRLVLAHKEIPHETVNIWLSHRPQWLYELSPLGMVPTLQWDDKLLYESANCNDYLDGAYPQKKLNPEDPYLRAKDRQLWESEGKLVGSFYDLNREVSKHHHNKTVVERMQRAVKRYESELESRGAGPYFGGKKVCMADFMLWPWFERIPLHFKTFPEIAITPETHPRLSTWMQHMYEEPAVKATILDLDSHVAFLRSYALKQWDYDYGLVPQETAAKL